MRIKIVIETVEGKASYKLYRPYLYFFWQFEKEFTSVEEVYDYIGIDIKLW